MPDVPAMLWWPQGEPFADPRFVKVSRLVDRMIVDSATFVDPEGGLRRMAGLLGTTTAISDLSWSRITPWRELSAQFFDVPAIAPRLVEIDRVAVEYEARPGEAAGRSQALLLIGWLASRLGWRPAGGLEPRDEIATLRMLKQDGGEVLVELRPAEPKEDALDLLASLTLACLQARFVVTRAEEADSALTRAEVEGMPPLQRTVRLESLDEADLIANELRLLGRDRTFESALRIAAELVGP
jgi:glucose-6-phosphate dehydrogenase assembly protein OpcA